MNQQAELQRIVDFLRKLAGEGDMASVQINSDGKVIVRAGVQYSRIHSLDEFCREYPEYRITE